MARVPGLRRCSMCPSDFLGKGQVLESSKGPTCWNMSTRLMRLLELIGVGPGGKYRLTL